MIKIKDKNYLIVSYYSIYNYITEFWYLNMSTISVKLFIYAKFKNKCKYNNSIYF